MSRQNRTSVSTVVALVTSAALTILTTGVLLPSPSAILAQTGDNNNDDLCGADINSDFGLTADLKCSDGDGIKVEGRNILINLNGFTLRGPGSNSSSDSSNTTGIFVSGDTIRIKGPGMITGFSNGIEFSDSGGGSVRDVSLGSNDVGILLDTVTDTQIKQNQFTDNRIGVLVRDSDNPEIENAHMARNDEGIHIEKSVSIDVDFNSIMDGKTGLLIDSDSSRNEIFYNFVFRNEVTDINLEAYAQGNDIGGGEDLFGNNQCTKSNLEICHGETSMQNQEKLQTALSRSD